MRFVKARSLVGIVVAGVVGGCAMGKGSAEDAIAAADSTLQTVAAEAQAYVPDLYNAAGAKVAAARADFDAGNYTDALAKAQEAATEAGGLGAAVTTRKDELAVTWTALNDSLPGTLDVLKARVDELAKMRRLPAGVSAQALSDARVAVEEMTTSWTQAMDAYASGNLLEATDLGTTVKTRAAEVMTSLGVK